MSRRNNPNRFTLGDYVQFAGMGLLAAMGIYSFAHLLGYV